MCAAFFFSPRSFTHSQITRVNCKCLKKYLLGSTGVTGNRETNNYKNNYNTQTTASEGFLAPTHIFVQKVSLAVVHQQAVIS